MSCATLTRLTFLALIIAVYGESLATTSQEVGENEIKVIGGGAVPFGQGLFMASLRSLTNVYFCGGAIVSTRFVLTSAMCTAGRAGNSINVVVGSNSLASLGNIHRSSSIITYPGFDAKTQLNE